MAGEASARHIKILLQTTIVTTPNDWSIARFGRLTQLLRNEKHRDGRPVFDVVARDRSAAGSPDPVLSRLDASDFDELWLFAVDTGNGLTEEDCRAITRFREGGRGLMIARDHMDLGSSVCGLGGVGSVANITITVQVESRRARHDDEPGDDVREETADNHVQPRGRVVFDADAFLDDG